MRRAGVAIALIALFLASESAPGSASEAGNACKSIETTRFELGARAGSQASVVRETSRGRFVTRAARTYSSVKFRFSLHGRAMAASSLRRAPADLKACFSETTHEKSRARGKLVCTVMSEPRCDEGEHGKCFVLACCNVNGVGVCGTGTASF